MHNWSIFDAWKNHGQTQIHKTHHGPNLGEAITSSLYNILYAWPWGLHSNVILSLNFFEIGTFATLEAHNILCRPRIDVKFEPKL
jgi:hypothetical protein